MPRPRVPRPQPDSTSSTPRPLPQAEWATWRRLMQVYQDRDTESAEIRARLVQWVTFVSPWLMGCNMLSAVLLAWTLPAAVAPWLRWSWCGAICALCLFGLAGWWRHRRKVPTRVGPTVVRKATLQAGALAALWAVLPWPVFAGGAASAQILIAGMMLGLVAGGGFV
ncbi:MAG: hypothetical protein ACJ8G1_27360, partial [Vitreoscilla sp.]